MEGQTDHSGTSVVFTAASTSAVTDSTLTDSGGTYSQALAVGLYDVSYRHDGYLPLTLPDPVLVGAEPVSLDDVTLEAGQFIELSGNTGDLHLTSGTIVRVVGFTRVSAGDTLLVDPGVRFVFPGYDTINIDGYAEFNGTVNDSIIFESAIPGAGSNAWSGLSIYGLVRMRYTVIRQANRLTVTNQNAAPPSEFDHCRIEHTSWAVALDLGATFRFRDCVIENNDQAAVRVSNSPGAYEDHLFERCLIRNTLYQNVTAVSVQNDGTLRLADCTIDADDPAQTHQYGVEVLGNASVEVVGCSIGNCWSAGIRIQGGPVLVESCLVDGNGTGLVTEAFWWGVVRNNTIVDNSLDGLLYNGGDGEVSHNIISGNGTGIYFDGSEGTINYNDIADNGTDIDGGYIPPYFGQTVTTNANGDPADINLNIFLSPGFVDAAGGDFTLQATSPCIDAGDPARLDPDGTPADLGAFPFDQSLTGVQTPELPTSSVSCSPNPFNPATVITFNVTREGRTDLSVFDLHGHLVKVLVDRFAPAGPNSVVWDGTDRDGRHSASGVYLLRLVSGGEVATDKILLAK